MADIPGLIEGAAEGAGLGHEFLAHVERCSMLVHLVDLAPLEGDPEADYETVRAELSAHGAGLERLPELVALTKRDLLEADLVEAAVHEWEQRLGDSVLGVARGLLGDGGGPGRAAPAGSWPSCPRANRRPSPRPASWRPNSRPSTASTGPPARAATGSSARRTAPTGSRAGGSSCSSSATTLKNEEALAYLEQRLGEIGVIAALTKAGFEAGDDVRVGEHEFELHI